MDGTMNFRGTTRYSYCTPEPDVLTCIIRRVARFLKALFSPQPGTPGYISDHALAHLYL